MLLCIRQEKVSWLCRESFEWFIKSLRYFSDRSLFLKNCSEKGLSGSGGTSVL